MIKQFNRILRVIPESPDIPAESDTQVNPGWGVLCCECKHVAPDEIKYVGFPPSFPCQKRKFNRSVPVFDLVRYVDGTESCPRFERQP